MIDPKKIFSETRIDDYIKKNPERVDKFREKLRKELLNPTLWYVPTKPHNRDVLVYHPECPYKKSPNGSVPEHRYVWWLHHPNDEIKYNEMIHHKNGNHQDNRIENLEKIKRKLHFERHKELGSYDYLHKPSSAIQQMRSELLKSVGNAEKEDPRKI